LKPTKKTWPFLWEVWQTEQVVVMRPYKRGTDIPAIGAMYASYTIKSRIVFTTNGTCTTSHDGKEYAHTFFLDHVERKHTKARFIHTIHKWTLTSDKIKRQENA
jgi:hypothetical protein